MPRQAAPKAAQLRPASLRDFGGGWNTSDNEYNLNSRFLPVLDNVNVGVDNALAVRYGYKLFAKLKEGTVGTYVARSVDYEVVSGSPYVIIHWTAHGLTSGAHITFTEPATVPNMPDALQGTYGIAYVDADSFMVFTRNNATGTSTNAGEFTGTTDTHVLGGNVLDVTYFQSRLIIFSDIGEIITVDADGNTEQIWNVSASYASAGNPIGWRMMDGEVPLKHVSFDTFKQSLLVVNGKVNDKPLDIDLTRTEKVQYLADPAVGSNSFVYSADLIQSFNSYVLLYNSNNTTTSSTNTDTTVDISASGTSSVFVGALVPDDAVQVDLGRVTQTIDPRITGVANIRDRLFIGFYDTAMLGSLGIYVADAHEPEFKDQIPQHGALNHRVLRNLGNDLLMCDIAGVPAFSQSLVSGSIVPERVSQLIAPTLNKHLGRLSDDTLRYKVYAVYNTRDHQYMLWVPKHDESSVFTTINGIYLTSDLKPLNQVLVYAIGHTVSEGDVVEVSGASSITGLPASQLNGTRTVEAVVDEDYFILNVDGPITADGEQGGGTVTFTPTNDENIGYIFTLNQQKRIRRWMRMRDLQFVAGCMTKEGRLIYCTDDTVYQFGTDDYPMYADQIGDYDYASYAPRTYETGDRVLDTGDVIFVCLEGYTAAEATFEAERGANSEKWEVYRGLEIEYEAETAWSDLGQRMSIKENKLIQFDAQGSGEFTCQVFVDDIKRSPSDFTYTPAAETTFRGNDAGGFGAGTQNFGGGRRTREQLLFEFPFIGKLVKIRLYGSTLTKLRISGIHLMHFRGSPIR